ncbi:MAG: arsenic resistance N-acetyltransferase ArsN2 [Desulfopila sp.]|nr:arsenic resistance N-acetyltransferase ArsN2 [Desulfopila sp.]
MIITAIKNISEAEALLGGCSLPTSDLQENRRIQLFGIHKDTDLVACIGVELYGTSALLRSLAVSPDSRREGTGRALSEFAEKYCMQNGVKEIYLLTETAENYFEKLGYSIQEKETAPSCIKGTTQFSGVCPASSRFMKKILPG